MASEGFPPRTSPLKFHSLADSKLFKISLVFIVDDYFLRENHVNVMVFGVLSQIMLSFRPPVLHCVVHIMYSNANVHVRNSCPCQNGDWNEKREDTDILTPVFISCLLR